MAKKIKDYYDEDCAIMLAEKLHSVDKNFPASQFISSVVPTLQDKEFSDRQTVFAEGFEVYLGDNYSRNLAIFTKILGPELPKSEGMFTDGWWLWPVGRYVERHATEDKHQSYDFIYELTKRFTGEFAIRPLLEAYPEDTLVTMQQWATDESVHVRRLASEGIRISLPWAKKSKVFLEHFDACFAILDSLKNDPDKFVQKSVGNNLNDLMKADATKANYIIDTWQSEDMSDATKWIIKHGTRSLRKK